MWARLEVENTGRQKAMVLIDIKGEPKVRSCSSMFNKEFGSSDPGPVGEPFFATGHFFFLVAQATFAKQVGANHCASLL